MVNTMGEIREWSQIALSLATLMSILWGILKVVSVAEKKIDDLDRRVFTLEESRLSIDSVVINVASLSGKVDGIIVEIERVRNRLDRFLDTQSSVRN